MDHGGVQIELPSSKPWVMCVRFEALESSLAAMLSMVLLDVNWL